MSTPLVQPKDLSAHIKFLKKVHVHGGDGLYFGQSLASGVERLNLWLEFVSSVGTTAGHPLVPPLDVAWAWHCFRLAPLRYREYCIARFGTVIEPGGAAFLAQIELDDDHEQEQEHEDEQALVLSRQTRDLWKARFADQPFFACPSGIETADLAAACAGLGYDIAAASGRQRTFLWQVSGPRFSDGGFLVEAIERYEQFLRLMSVHKYDEHFFVPSYDIDLVWHTHMLATTDGYVKDTERIVGEPVDHDDSVNERHEGSKLNTSWEDTKDIWGQTFGHSDVATGTARIDKPGACYRGEPPQWWFAPAAETIVSIDGFMSEKEIQDALGQLPHRGTAEATKDLPKGLRTTVSVTSELRQRIRCLVTQNQDEDAAGANEVIPTHVAIDADNHDQDEELGVVVASEMAEVPARVQLFGIPAHKDLLHGTGPVAEGYTAVVYLAGGGTLILRDDFDGTDYPLKIVPGLAVAWPNGRFTHRVKASGDKVARAMLGPLTVDNPSSKTFTVVGGGGCGGGGGGCGGGGGGCGWGSSTTRSGGGRTLSPEEAAQQNLCMWVVACLLAGIIMVVLSSKKMDKAVLHEYCMDYEQGARTGKHGIDQWAEEASCYVRKEGYMIAWWLDDDDEVNEYYTVPFGVTVTRDNGDVYNTTAYRSPINFGNKDGKGKNYCGEKDKRIDKSQHCEKIIEQYAEGTTWPCYLNPADSTQAAFSLASHLKEETEDTGHWTRVMWIGSLLLVLAVIPVLCTMGVGMYALELFHCCAGCCAVCAHAICFAPAKVCETYEKHKKMKAERAKNRPPPMQVITRSMSPRAIKGRFNRSFSNDNFEMSKRGKAVPTPNPRPVDTTTNKLSDTREVAVPEKETGSKL